jgi:hypothetical protein
MALTMKDRPRTRNPIVTAAAGSLASAGGGASVRAGTSLASVGVGFDIVVSCRRRP